MVVQAFRWHGELAILRSKLAKTGIGKAIAIIGSKGFLASGLVGLFDILWLAHHAIVGTGYSATQTSPVPCFSILPMPGNGKCTA